MKISSILVLLSLSCVDATQKRLRATSDADKEKEGSLITNGNHRGLERGEYCESTALYRYSGASTLISATGALIPSQGDVSIANELLPEPASINYPKIKAICTITAADAFSSPPFCTLETTIDSSSDRIMSMGTPPALTIMGGTGNFEGAYGTMVTDETFTNINGIISFGAMLNYCLPSPPSGGGGGSTGGNGGNGGGNGGNGGGNGGNGGGNGGNGGGNGGNGGGNGGNGGGNGGNGGGNGGPGATAPCTNSYSWKTRSQGRTKRCSWVAGDTSKRCNLMGKIGQDNVMAGIACALTCDPSC